MSTASTPEVPETTAPSSGRRRTAARAAAYLLGSAGLGALTGVLWWAIVDLPVYAVGPDGVASTSERGLAEYIAADAWFSVIGFVAGVALGLIGWRLFRRAGWPVVPLAVVASLMAALVCWLIGWELGPGPFAPRIGAAPPGSLVPSELTVRARVAVLVWPFGAVLSLLLSSTLGPDDEEPRPILRSRSRRPDSPD